MSAFTCWDESGYRVDIDADTAEDAAAEYVDGGDWPDEGRTIFHTIYVEHAGEVVDHVTVTTDPPEPACSAEAHSWREVVLQCHGGGVRIIERCSHCQLDRATDTWATNPCDGSQGHTSITYETESERGELSDWPDYDPDEDGCPT